MTTVVLGGGCFWCLDAVFRGLKGVSQSECGYSGGHHQSPTYELVSSGTTGHAEVVCVEFDEAVIPAATLLDIYFLVHDPTTPNRQGADVGTQYRSVMLYADDPASANESEHPFPNLTIIASII
jgi:peptide-methionine (S)-S-oxide reductase